MTQRLMRRYLIAEKGYST